MKKIILLCCMLIMSVNIIADDVPFMSTDIKQRKVNEDIYYKLNKLEGKTTIIENDIEELQDDNILSINAYDVISTPKGRLQKKNVQDNLYELDNLITSSIATSDNNSYWEIDPVNGGLMTRDTSLVTISDDYWELLSGDLTTK